MSWCDCWRVSAINHRHSSSTMNEPLLSVNPNGGDANNMQVEPTSNEPLKHEVSGTWRKLKISMVFIFGITVLAVGLLIYGSVLLARASNNYIQLVSSLQQNIPGFQESGYLRLIATNFSVNVGGTIYPLASTEDPFQNIVEANSEDTPYNSTIFQADGIAFADIVANETSINANEGNATYTLTLVINYCLVDNNEQVCDPRVATNTPAQGSFAVVVPALRYTVTSGSMREGPTQCTAAGGYFDKVKSQCIQLSVLTQVCVKLMNDSNGWHLDSENGGIGCNYPFSDSGTFETHSYTSNITQLLSGTFQLVIRSSADPYIFLEELSSGQLNLIDVLKSQRDVGSHFIMLALIVIVGSLLFFVALFFIKRRVKREYKAASRIPFHYSRLPLFRYLIISVISFGVCIGIGFPLLSHWNEILYWTWTPVIGLLLIIYAGPIGLISLLIFWQLLQKMPNCPANLRGSLGGLVGSVLVVLSAIATAALVKPWTFPASVPLDSFFGVVTVLAFMPFAVLLLVLAAIVFFSGKPKADKDAKKLIQRDLKTGRARRGITMALVGIAVLVITCLASAFLPPLWYTQIVGVYNIFNSPFSVIPGNNSSILVVKLYLDVVVFYGFIGALIVVAVGASVSRPLRRFVGYWIRVRFGKLIVSTSIGEIGFILMVAGLAGWWFWWWFWGYSRIAQIATFTERLARAFGHMANLFAALLLLPVTRNSMWVEIIGIPFERAVKYHRWAGVVVFFSVTAHMLVWWVNWSNSGTLLHNIFSSQNIPHTDNWSIPMVELSWLGAAVMVLLSQNYFRRHRFELFYYTHHFFIVFFITGLIHAWSMWYFTGGGMILWFIDRLIRYYKSFKTYPTTDIQVYNRDTTQISLQPNNFSFRAGQYAFINIPSISPLEWHPFTISSSPDETAITFHIKNMGKNTWTSRLARIYGIDSESFSSIPTLPIVNIDGPYGNPPDFTEHRNIILVAGGIGITPIISIFKDLYRLHRQNHVKTRQIKNVYLLWVVRDVQSLDMFRDFFDEVMDTASTDTIVASMFHIMLRVTQRSFSAPKVVDGADPAAINPTPVMGRPNMQREFSDIARVSGSDAIAMVCGPAPMVAEVENASYQCKFELHMETFEL